jgi:hypothetical protein
MPQFAKVERSLPKRLDEPGSLSGAETRLNVPEFRPAGTSVCPAKRREPPGWNRTTLKLSNERTADDENVHAAIGRRKARPFPPTYAS